METSSIEGKEGKEVRENEEGRVRFDRYVLLGAGLQYRKIRLCVADRGSFWDTRWLVQKRQHNN